MGQVRAHGSAADVSGLLRAMESEDAEVREEAMRWLVSSSWRDDDLAVATARAVPQLARLALQGPGHRADLLDLLAGLGSAFTPARPIPW